MSLGQTSPGMHGITYLQRTQPGWFWGLLQRFKHAKVYIVKAGIRAFDRKRGQVHILVCTRPCAQGVLCQMRLKACLVMMWWPMKRKSPGV